MISSELEQVRANISSFSKFEQGTVRLGTSESFTRAFLPELMHQFHAQYPGISFQVHVAGGAKLIDDLVRHRIDLILGYLIPDNLAVSVVAKAYAVPSLLLPISHPFSGRQYIEVKECADLEIAFPDEGLTIRESYVRMFQAAQINPKVVLTTDSFELMRAAAATGLCHAIVNQFFGVTKLPPGFRYVPLRGDGVEPWPISLCVRKSRSMPLATKHFSDFARQQMAAGKQIENN